MAFDEFHIHQAPFEHDVTDPHQLREFRKLIKQVFSNSSYESEKKMAAENLRKLLLDVEKYPNKIGQQEIEEITNYLRQMGLSEDKIKEYL